MRRARRGLLAALMLFPLSGAAHGGEFAELVRELNVMQNRMVVGDATARDQAARHFDMIEKAIGALEPEGWADEKNQRAALIYLLCGGAPAGLREIHEAQFDAGKLEGLLGAGIEYAEGAGDSKALQDFDARHLPPMLGGHLALVQGSALMGADNARAIMLFDLARLLMPGSLVEEAALRREIAVLDPARDVGKLVLLSTRYASKYLASPYAQNFWDVLRRATIADPQFLGRAPRFEPIFAKGPAGERAAYYLAIARMALLAGDFEEARRTIDLAGRSATHPITVKRIDAYHRILASLTQETGAPPLTQKEIDALDKKDSALVAIAASVSEGLSARPGPSPAADDDYAIADLARREIAKSDELLRKAGPQ
jgi:chemotaxis protein MotC